MTDPADIVREIADSALRRPLNAESHITLTAALDALVAERDRWRAVACNVKDKYDQGWHDAVIAARGRAARDERRYG